LERNPRLVVSWGHLALNAPQLSNVFAVFAHLAHITTDQRQAYDRYLRALSLLAKNDIFSQFEATIMVEFYEAFRADLAGYGDWDGVPSTFETPAEKILGEIF